MILLTDEEISKISFDAINQYTATHNGAKAQLKRVVEFIDWLDNGTRSSGSWRTETRLFKQALVKECE